MNNSSRSWLENSIAQTKNGRPNPEKQGAENKSIKLFWLHLQFNVLHKYVDKKC